MTQNQTTPVPKVTAKAGFLDWISPSGVITVREMLFRGIVATVIALSPLGIHQVFFPEAVDGDLAITLLGSFAGFAIPFFFVVLIASLTKHYRTVGVKAPFVLTILTPAFPFMFIVKWWLSSRELSKRNTALAYEQYALRRGTRLLPHKTGHETGTVVRRR